MKLWNVAKFKMLFSSSLIKHSCLYWHLANLIISCSNIIRYHTWYDYYMLSKYSVPICHIICQIPDTSVLLLWERKIRKLLRKRAKKITLSVKFLWHVVWGIKQSKWSSNIIGLQLHTIMNDNIVCNPYNNKVVGNFTYMYVWVN